MTDGRIWDPEEPPPMTESPALRDCAMLKLNGEHNFYAPTGDCLQCGAHYKDVIADLFEQRDAALREREEDRQAIRALLDWAASNSPDVVADKQLEQLKAYHAAAIARAERP